MLRTHRFATPSIALGAVLAVSASVWSVAAVRADEAGTSQGTGDAGQNVTVFSTEPIGVAQGSCSVQFSGNIVAGKVQQLTASGFTLETPDGTVTVRTNADTTYSKAIAIRAQPGSGEVRDVIRIEAPLTAPEDASAADVTVGTMVHVIGEKGSDGVVTAKRVVLMPEAVAGQPGATFAVRVDGPLPAGSPDVIGNVAVAATPVESFAAVRCGDLDQKHVFGQIESISGDTVTVKTPGGSAQVRLTGDTSYRKLSGEGETTNPSPGETRTIIRLGAPEPASRAVLAVGQQIHAEGEKDANGVLTASTVTIMPELPVRR